MNWLAFVRGYFVLMAVWFVLACVVCLMADPYASPESKSHRFIMLGVLMPIGSCVAFVLYLAFVPVWGWINGK